MNTPVKILRTNAKNKDFIALVRDLDDFLAITDGDEHAFYDQFNTLDRIDHVVVLYTEGEAVSCGAIKKFDETGVEIKRMFTRKDFRGRRLAESVLESLEQMARDLGYTRCTLETGIRQTAAIALYERCGYKPIPCYEPYKDMPNSVCFEKELDL